MRRPLYVGGINLGVGIVFQYYFSFRSMCIIVLAVVLIFIFKQKICIFMIIGMFLLSMQIKDFDKFDNKLDKEVSIDGRASVIKKETVQGGYDKLSFVLTTNENDKFYCRFYNSSLDDENFSGRHVKVIGVLKKPEERRNPKGFDSKLYMRSKDIGYIIEGKTISPRDIENEDLLGKAINEISLFRESFLEKIDDILGERESSILRALMFGAKENLDEEIYESFQRNGTAHLLATSGLHVGIIYGVLCTLLPIGRRKIPNIVVLLMLMIYIVMADFNPAIIRAVIMIGVRIVANVLHYRYDILTGTAVAMILLLTLDPMNIFNMGFQMSFLAVWTIGITFPRMKNIKIMVGIKKSLLSILVLQIVLAPFIMYHFNYFSLSSFIANIPVTFIATLALPVGIIGMIFPLIGQEIPHIYGELLNVLLRIFDEINTFTYMNGKWVIDVISPPLAMILIFYGCLFLTTDEEMRIYWGRKAKKKVFVKIGMVAIVISIIFAFNVNKFKGAEAIFIDVGQGNSMLFRKDGQTILVDGGGNHNYDIGRKLLKPLLLKNGIGRIDIAIVTHFDEDHYGGIKSLAQEGMIEKIAVYSANSERENVIAKECGISKDQIFYISKGSVIEMNNSFSVEVIAPKDKIEKEEENARSLVFKVNISEKRFIITGDIDEEVEKSLKGDLKADVLQIPHHGSKGSSSEQLIDRVNPDIAVFQVGVNNYGHPSVDVIEKYDKKCIITFRNDIQGAIGFSIVKGKIKAVTMIEENK